jgi:hypothetical protein
LNPCVQFLFCRIIWEQALINAIIDVKRKLEDMKRNLGDNISPQLLQEYDDTITKVEAAKEAINHLVGTFNNPQ